MSEPRSQRGMRNLRKQYVVDRTLQWGIAWRLLVTLLGVAALYGLGVHLLLDDGSLQTRGPAEIRNLLLTATAGYFLLGIAVVAIVALLLTHRVAGPKYVLASALDGMLAGDYQRRLKLRRGDYLQDLAERLEEVRGAWVAREQEVARAVLEGRRALDAGDLEGVRAGLARLNPNVRDGPEAQEEPAGSPLDASQVESSSSTPCHAPS